MRRVAPQTHLLLHAVLIVIDMGSEMCSIVCYFTTAAGRVCQPHEPQLHAQLPGGGDGLRRAPHNRGVHAACRQPRRRADLRLRERDREREGVPHRRVPLRHAQLPRLLPHLCRQPRLPAGAGAAMLPSMPLHRSSTSMRALECCSSGVRAGDEPAAQHAAAASVARPRRAGTPHRRRSITSGGKKALKSIHTSSEGGAEKLDVVG